jgi:hypothetical protein
MPAAAVACRALHEKAAAGTRRHTAPHSCNSFIPHRHTEKLTGVARCRHHAASELKQLRQPAADKPRWRPAWSSSQQQHEVIKC